jgi:REP element-mobilizing transposase RayT
MVTGARTQNQERLPQRRATRLKGYDYSTAGAYFITMCTQDKRCLFGTVENGVMHLNRLGALVEEAWQDLPRRFPGVELDEWMIMPNHFHGIIVFPGDGVRHDAIEVARAFKAVCSTRIRKMLLAAFAWQKGMHDRIIRNERELSAVRAYIANNPKQWELDRDNPERRGRGNSAVARTEFVGKDSVSGA